MAEYYLETWPEPVLHLSHLAAAQAQRTLSCCPACTMRVVLPPKLPTPTKVCRPGWPRDKQLSSLPACMGRESRSPGANLCHTRSHVTQSPPEQLPQTQKGNNDSTWAENSIPSKGTLGILAPLSSPAHSCCCLPGRVALQQPLLFHWQIGSLERNQEGLLSPAIHTATPKP